MNIMIHYWLFLDSVAHDLSAYYFITMPSHTMQGMIFTQYLIELFIERTIRVCIQQLYHSQSHSLIILQYVERSNYN
jgi:hypothetical protein